MGMRFSCPLTDSNTNLESSSSSSSLIRSISFGAADQPKVSPSLSFNGRQSKCRIRSFGSGGKMILQGSLSFKGTEFEATFSLQSPSSNPEDNNITSSYVPLQSSAQNRHLAALKLQKTYKSFRTRRQLADCAVLVEQRWWKLLDLAELKHSSISFFDVDRPETAVSRWSRARTRAAKVGKGLSKDDKARKLALQHWLEAIDPRHRYGHNLQFYYVNWLHCESRQPFFYWLDIGEGREVNLDKCPRSKLQQQCIKYLDPCERSAYEVTITDGRLIYRQTGRLLDTREGPEDVKWIFVLSVSKILYVGQKKKGKFQHSSFLAGGATLSAGRIVVEDGILKAVWPHSGHYLPTEENFEEFMAFLTQHNVDLSAVQRAPDDADEVSIFRRNSLSVPDPMSSKTIDLRNDEGGEEIHSNMYHHHHPVDADNTQPSVSRWSRKLQSKISLLEIPRQQVEMAELFMTPKSGSPLDDGYETAEENLSDSEFSVSKQNLFEEEYEEQIPKEKIMKRINSHKGMKSYQLAKQLSCKWTTGAGPRIGCVRDYPSELQFRALEEVSLSPRSAYSSPRKPNCTTPSSFCRDGADNVGLTSARVGS